jgi:site-specific DNA-methyltransferase (adenine-specific)
MNERAHFSLRARNPDVLSCIANLSNDEVFTPPELANQMLDTLAEAWAKAHDGADIWADRTATFLDPCAKSGVFLREITSRLTKGLTKEIPDLDERVDHILSKQVFGIGITQLTSLLARRSLYCSKFANGEHSICRSFDSPEGNVWFSRTEHAWDGEKCKFCGASANTFERGEELESHAYAFIHTENIKARVVELFGDDMQFDVIIGNPPYQLNDGGHGRSASPLYHRFVKQAKCLDPKMLIMIIPSRWFGGGKGLNEFRAEMLADKRISKLVDFENARDAFSGVDLAGGVCYFLWERDSRGMCEVVNFSKDRPSASLKRVLNEFPTFIRDSDAVTIVRKVLAKKEATMSGQVSSRKPFGLSTTARPEKSGELRLRWRGGEGLFPRKKVTAGIELIDRWKVITSRASYDHAGNPGKDGRRRVLATVEILEPGVICTETYLVAGAFDTRTEAKNLVAYMKTRFFRFLLAQLMYSHDLAKSSYEFVPVLDMTKRWSDADLFQRYDITEIEQEWIQARIREF